MKQSIKTGLLVCAFLATMFTTDVKAEPYQFIRMGASLDYNILVMEQVNKHLNKGVNVTELNSGISAALDLNLILAPAVMIGVRVGYLYGLPASATYQYLIFEQKKTINASLIPLEAGLSLNFELPETPISFMAGVYAGYGFTSIMVVNDYIPLVGQTISISEPYSGKGYVGELVASINLKVMSALSLNLNGGYRMAKIVQVARTTDINYNGIPFVTIPLGKKGDVMKDSDNNDLAFDFGGYNIGLGLSIGF